MADRIDTELAGIKKDLSTLSNNQILLDKKLDQILTQIKAFDQSIGYITDTAQNVVSIYNNNKDDINQAVKKIAKMADIKAEEMELIDEGE